MESFWRLQKQCLASENKEKSSFSENYDALNILCIPEKELPPKPNQRNVESLKDFLQRNELKNKELMNIMRETAFKNEPKQSFIETEENKKAEAKLKKSGISEGLLAKVINFKTFGHRFKCLSNLD